jgi:ubiquinone/menaquinone biosynthesis C-methylase UbiE
MSSDVERWKALDAASYDDVAEQFDIISNQLSTAAARRLLGLAAARRGDRVLDVGTGAGLLPFELLRSDVAVGPILGIDLSRGMIAAARQKAGAQGIDPSRLRFEEMDAERLALGDASFDLVLSAFALTHVPHPEVALREIYRVLRPGGRVAIAVGSRPPLVSGAGLLHAVREVRRRVQVTRGRRLTTDLLDRIVEREYGPLAHDLPRGSELSRQLNRAALLTNLVSAVGFTRVRRSWRNYQNEVRSAEEFWEIHRTIRSDSRKRLLGAPSATIERVRARFMDECRRTLRKRGVLAFPISAVFVVAERPASG